MKAVLTSLILLGVSSMAMSQDRTVELFRVDTEKGVELHARNTNIFPVTITVQVERKNLRPDRALPLTEVLRAGESRKLMNLTAIEQNKTWEFNTRYSFSMGSIKARHRDSYQYRLPYRLGTEHLVAQGYDGDFSHSGPIRYSIDFQMDEGTEIYAARSGLVVESVESYREGGQSPMYMDKANYITILHDDGTFADYSHLKYQGSAVRVGQRVRTGQLIGYSGATGFASGPHLHFNVKKAAGNGTFITLPVKFKSSGGSVSLSEGRVYKAL